MAPAGPSNLTFFLAGLLGLGPALALMFYTLRNYDYPYVEKALFSDRRLFASFAVGMVAGTASAALTYFLLPASDFALILVVLLLVALFDELFKMVYLNLRTLRGRFDATFYGAALGLAMGGSSSMAFAYVALGTLGLGTVTVAFSLAVALSLVGVEFFAGSLLGSGAANGRMVQPLGEALAARTLVAVPLALLLSPPDATVGWAAGVLAVGGGLGLAWMAHATVLPEALPQDVRRGIRRRRRRLPRTQP